MDSLNTSRQPPHVGRSSILTQVIISRKFIPSQKAFAIMCANVARKIISAANTTTAAAYVDDAFVHKMDPAALQDFPEMSEP